MGLSRERAKRHIQDWSERLRVKRKVANWPSHLFHAVHVTTAVKILRDGYLRARDDLSAIDHDVANQEALRNNPEAHRFTRLYFRPRNSFHYATEGIKCLTDPYRQKWHMSIPVMFAFSAQEVLARCDAGFSRGKLSRVREIGGSESFFETIEFDKVYHDGEVRDLGVRKDIHDRRMAEVVLEEALPLAGNLRYIICRTPLEKVTFLHQLGTFRRQWEDRMVVEQTPGSTFFHREIYLSDIGLYQGVLQGEIHPPNHTVSQPAIWRSQCRRAALDTQAP